MKKEPTLLDTARAAVALARRHGAQEAAAQVARDRDVELAWRDGKLEKLSEATTLSLGLELYVDGRYASVSTSDLRPAALGRFVEDSVALARVLAADAFRALPDPRFTRRPPAVDLELVDAAHPALDGARRRALAQEAEAAARAVPGAGAILSVTASLGDGSSELARVHSSGFEGTRTRTTHALSVEVSVQDPDGRRPEDYAYAYATHLAALGSAAAVGRSAAARALARIGARKGATAARTVVVDPRAAGRLLAGFTAALSAQALQQKRSFLDGKLGEAVASARLTLLDDPHLKRGLGSRLFDPEGITARPFPVVEGGVLRSYYVDNYYGRKLGMDPTTRAPSNLTFAPGAKGRDALVADVKDGILVTGFIGGNSNATTGDFSHGVLGFEIAGGALGRPLGEMNVSGNHLELWKRLVAVGDDPFPYSPVRTPTLVFEDLMVAGV